LFAYKENYGPIVRNAAAWGIDFKGAEKNELLKILCEYPARRGMQDHLIHMQRAITDFEPERIAIDSISAVERITPRRAFREFV
jgi:circadian clock protein KaiC